ncbi:MAG TPA: TrbI/VirB10 family protein [Acidobacteriota bacterium]|nr:TrbI/VirB10 family protein [Acidobacteriota bacterium]
MNAPNVPNSSVTEEQPDPPKKKRPLLLAIAGSLVILFAGVLTLLFALDPGDAPSPSTTPDQLAQQVYDRKQQTRAEQKAGTLADHPFVNRGPTASPAEEMDKLLAQSQRSAGDEQDASPSEEEFQRRARRVSLVEQILKQQQAEESPAAAGTERYSYDTRANRLGERKYEEEKRSREKELDRQPMFVYSRSFRKADYFDEPAGKPAESSSPAERVKASFRSSAPEQPAEGAAPRPEKAAPHPPVRVVFNERPPVRLAEGEFIDTVLTQRIVADTEESPVVCAVSRDLIDNSGRFVLLPAGTRIVGRSQTVTYMGASRLFINLHRMLLPNGAAVDFPASQRALNALDRTGALGAVTRVNRHWGLQFGAAIFVGVLEGLGAAAQARTDPYSGRAYVIDDTTDNFEKILNTIMQRYTNIVPTITVGPGYRMKIFLTEDVWLSPYAPVSERPYASR